LLDTAPPLLLGSKRPSISTMPPTAGSHGDRVLQFSELCGLTLDEWQTHVIRALFAVDDDGAWAASEFGALVSRQNGKGEILVAYDLAHLFLFPRPDGRRKTILHTAHEMKTAVDGFQRLAGVIESTPKLLARVDNIYTANGQEGIVLKKRPGQLQGDRCRFIARSKKSGRGFSADTLVYDEAQELSLQASNALSYTQSQIRNPQGFFTGTVPEEGVNDGEVWEGVRDRGRTRTGKRTGWMEWTPEGSADPDTADAIDSGDYLAWIAANPSMGHRMPVSSVQDQYERALMTDPDGFRRERLSIWPNRRPAATIKNNDLDLEAWNNGTDNQGTLLDGAVIALALGRGGGYASVAAASLYDDTSVFVEHKRTERQTLWVAEYVQELKKELGDALVVLDPKNAGPIITDLDRLGIKYLAMNLNEVTAAFSMFVEYVNAGLVWHRDQQEVATSLEFAAPRAIGQAGFTWDASDATKPVTLAQAVTWAVWGVRKRESSPPPTPALVRGYA
jgi:phage terminase large subunit-like protein